MAKKPQLDRQLRKWLDSVNKFLHAWRVVRICPEKIQAPKEQLSFNVLTLAISLAIVVLARASVAGSNRAIDAIIIATVISVAIVFLTGYVTLVIIPGRNAMENARKWGTFFVLMWLTSLLLLVILDALPFWLGYNPVTTSIVDAVFGPGGVSPLTKDALRAGFFGVGALAILVFKTRRMDSRFHIFSRCALATMIIGLAVNTALMGGFIYGHLI